MNLRFILYMALPAIAFLIWQFNWYEGRFVATPSEEHRKGTELVVGFYNIENLFDTLDDKTIDDNEFLPTSKSRWTSERYHAKLRGIAKVIDAMNDGKSPDILGLCEIENKSVLDDLVREPQIANRKFGIVHYDSPDQRGIDVALLYKPDKFTVVASKPLRVALDDDPNFKTRDILWVTGLVGKRKDTLHVFVNHWPSRRGGMEASEHKRVAAAQTLRTYIDILRQNNANARIVVMGDFNDEPTNTSISTTLGALDVFRDGCHTCLYNPMYTLKKEKKGTYFYQGNWDMIDHIMFTQNLAHKDYYKSNLSQVVIFQQDWMMFTDEKTGIAKPNRTYVGSNYVGGYADHLPVYATIVVR